MSQPTVDANRSGDPTRRSPTPGDATVDVGAGPEAPTLRDETGGGGGEDPRLTEPDDGSRPPPTAPGLAAAQTVPGFEILCELGRGGMGVVYKARHVALDRTVALKMILAGAHASDDHLARFTTEAQAIPQLRHPSIIQVHDIGECGGLP